MTAKRVGFIGLVGVILALLVGPTAIGKTLVINEIAWAGSAASSADEWIELVNVSDEPIDLVGWTLVFADTVIHLGELDGATREIRQSAVGPDDFLLLERTDDATISDIEADLIYVGNLINTGLVLRLIDANGDEVDTANANQEGWAAGSASTVELPYATMERVDPAGADVPGNWHSNDGVIRCGSDANGETLNGTPGAKNSAAIIAETVPVVTLIAPTESADERAQSSIIWSAVDPDGPPEQLRIDIYLSSDGGETWEPLLEGLANSGAYTWDPTALPDGTSYQLKVTATDREDLFGEAVSPVFAIANEP